jgi:arylsulfatase A-like enzyme
MSDSSPAARSFHRRDFLKKSSACVAATSVPSVLKAHANDDSGDVGRRPNVVFLLADQWRAQATGYAGDPNVQTPHIDRLAGQSVNFENAVSTCPVCTPYRASLLTGRYPLSTGMFLNDIQLPPDSISVAEAYKEAGYDTAYIGKWHLDGRGRSSFTPPERRQGFDYWRTLECTHNYNRSVYYADTPEQLVWKGYDASAQTEDACRYIRDREEDDNPFFMVLSWGPPHNPYETAPDQFKGDLTPSELELRPNVPETQESAARRDLAGYYAHCRALDACVGRVVQTLERCGLTEDTILVFTSDHGDMIGSQGERRKQRPWDESIRVPLLVRYPALLGSEGVKLAHPIGTPDLMPTLLGASGLTPPESCEGTDRTPCLTGETPDGDDAALITCPSPFGEWTRAGGGREYRGVRTSRYTYVRTLDGPWLLYDNEADPYQMENLIDRPEHAALQSRLDTLLNDKLTESNDDFEPGEAYIEKWGYVVGANGTVPYHQ